jgi:hypothetical protein
MGPVEKVGRWHNKLCRLSLLTLNILYATGLFQHARSIDDESQLTVEFLIIRIRADRFFAVKLVSP